MHIAKAQISIYHHLRSLQTETVIDTLHVQGTVLYKRLVPAGRLKKGPDQAIASAVRFWASFTTAASRATPYVLAHDVSRLVTQSAVVLYQPSFKWW